MIDKSRCSQCNQCSANNQGICHQVTCQLLVVMIRPSLLSQIPVLSLLSSDFYVLLSTGTLLLATKQGKNLGSHFYKQLFSASVIKQTFSTYFFLPFFYAKCNVVVLLWWSPVQMWTHSPAVSVAAAVVQSTGCFFS